MKQSNQKKYTLEELIEMIPSYINGAILSEDKSLFETALKNNEKLLKEYNFLVSINNEFQQNEILENSTSNAIFNKIEKSIDYIDNSSAIKMTQNQKPSSLIKTIQDWLLAPQLAWGITAALSIFIATGTINNIDSENNTPYQTLSQTTSQVNNSGNLIQVVLKKDSTYSTITQLLQKSQTEIVDGFKSDGVVILRAKNSRVAINQLKQSPEVLFVEQSMQ